MQQHTTHRTSQRHTQQGGALNILLIPFLLMTVFFIAAAGFGFWAYSSGHYYNTNVSQIAAQRVTVAQQQLNAQKDKEFAVKAKYPFRVYTSPTSTGSVVIKYPKTWSSYVEEMAQSSVPVDGYFHPGFVPEKGKAENNFALRVRILQQSYDTVLQQYDPYVTQGNVVVRPYRSPNIPSIVGTRLDGRIQEQKQGTMIMMPIRDKTLELWTESTDLRPDFFDIILPNFTFTP